MRRRRVVAAVVVAAIAADVAAAIGATESRPIIIKAHSPRLAGGFAAQAQPRS